MNDLRDFIGVFPNAVATELCEALINGYEASVQSGFGRNRNRFEGIAKTKKEDALVFLSDTYEIFGYKLSSHVIELIWNCYHQYVNQYNVLLELNQHFILHAKIQKTEIGQGYHIWHCEAGDRVTSGRLLAYTIYLNDVEEGGETEFLYYPRRVKPKAGTVCLFPAGFTHAHRGNPPLTGTKYILTGWIEF